MRGRQTNQDQREKLLLAGRIAKEARDRGIMLSEPGVRVLDVVDQVEELIRKMGGQPAFPVNIGIDAVAAHYTPATGDSQRFPPRGILKFDVGVHVDGYIADTAASKDLGGSNNLLVSCSQSALEQAIETVKAGISLRYLGGVIERTIQSSGYRPVTNLMGHSIERYNLHAGFSVPNVSDISDGTVPDDIVIAIEPFATSGKGFVVSGRIGNIFSLVRRKKLDDASLNQFQEVIDERYSTLPFAERWLSEFGNRTHLLRKLLRLGILHGYQTLIEASGAPVSQWEHTLIVSREGVVATSK